MQLFFFYMKAAKTQILLGSYLNTKIDLFDIKRVRIMWKQCLFKLLYYFILPSLTIFKKIDGNYINLIENNHFYNMHNIAIKYKYYLIYKNYYEIKFYYKI